MCEFCDAVKQEKDIKWLLRNTYADDNICEKLNGADCSMCDSCRMDFTLSPIEFDDGYYVSVDYEQRITSADGDRVIIHPSSEKVKINYCPVCGEQISREIGEFNRYYMKVIDN